MTLTQLLVAFVVVGALLTVGAAFDVRALMDHLAVRIAGLCLPLWELVEPLLR